MKKALYLLIAMILLSTSVQAQLTHKGVRFGLGASYVADDFLTRSPILGSNLGVFANYGFENAQSFWADNLYLQFGISIARRGTNIEQTLDSIRSYRYGYYHNYMIEIPVLACWRYELPILQPDHYLNFYAGPVASCGLFGFRKDRQVTPGYPQTSMNYDTDLSSNKNDRRSFKHQRRFDIGSQVGIGYKHNNIAIDLFWIHGFVPVMQEADVLRSLAISNNGGSNTYTDSEGNQSTLSNRGAYTGTSQSFILSISYMIPWN